MAGPARSHWPLHLEPQPDLSPLPQPSLQPVSSILEVGFLMNADDTPRYGAPVYPWPKPAARRPAPAFRERENEDQTRAA